MTQEKVLIVMELMNQMDSHVQNYAIDMLRFLRFSQENMKNREKTDIQKNTTKANS